MKKRLLSFLVAAAMVAAMVPATGIPAAEVKAAQMPQLTLDSQGNGECLYCNKTVKWTEFTGQAITGVDNEHLHYYMAEDIDTSVLGADAPQYLIYLNPKQMMCLHLNGHTLTTGSGVYIRGGDDASTALNIIGYGGEYVYTANRTSVGMELRYDLLRIYGGTYTYAPAEGKSGTLFRVHRYPTIKDATINGTIAFAAKYVVMELDGSTTVSQIDYKGYAAKINLKQSWTGSATLKLPSGAVVDGVVSPERVVCVPKPTGELGGKLTLSTGEKLAYRNGQLVVPSLQVNSDGYANCTVCNASVKWTKLDGTQAFTVTGEHQHFYLEEDTDYICAIAQMLTLATGGKVCLHLNGYTLMVYDAEILLSSHDAVLNIIGAGGKIGYTERSLIQQTAGTVNVFGGTYLPVYGIPFVSNAAGTVVLKNAFVDADLKTGSGSAVLKLQGTTEVGKVDLSGGGNLALSADWSGTATLDMETADLVGGKVPASKVSYTGKPAGKVKLSSGRVLEYRDGVLAKPVDLALDAENRGLCPMCKQTVKWTALTADGIASSNEAHCHVYLADNLLSTNPLELIEPYANEKVCLHLNGYDLTTGSIVHAAGGEVRIYGYGSNYTFTGQQAGGNVGIYAYSGGAVNIYGGNYIFAPVQGAESTKMVVTDSLMRIEDATVNVDAIMGSENGQLTLAGDTNITGNIRFGSGSVLRGKLIVEESFSGAATVQYNSSLVSGSYILNTRGTAGGDFTGQLKLSNGKRLINSDGRLKFSIVADPLTWKDLNALPIANNSMTEEQLRQLCVDFFRTTLSFAWTPKADAYYQNKATSPAKNYHTGTVYGGTPYVTSTTGTVYTAMEYYDPITGTLDISGDAKQTIMKFSNQCSGSAFWAWNRVCTSVAYGDTSTTLLYYGCLPVGPYTYPEDLTKWEQNVYEKSTLGICETNGEQTMFESYALMKPADGILTVRPNMDKYPANGHNRMITTDPVVVRNADGTINGTKSYVYYIDQDGEYTADTQPDGTSYTHIGVDTKFTFKEMYDEAYIPFTFAELVGEKPVDRSVTTMDYTGKSVTVSKLNAATVTSNYSISDITITVRDAAGNQVYRKLTSSNEYGATRPNHLNVKVSYAVEKEALDAYTDGNHTVEVSVRIGTGEKPVVYSGKLCAAEAAKITGGTTVWYDTVAEAVGAYTQADFAAGNYLKVFSNSEVRLAGGSYYVDAAGFDLAVTGTGKLYAFDSENNDFDGFGSWTVAEGIEIVRDFVAPDGNRYLVVTRDGVTSAHALVLELAGVLVNTGKAGLSYQAQYKCDDVLSEMISAYGIVASLKDMPGTGLDRGDARTKLLAFTPDDNHEVLSSSSYVYGIFKEDRMPEDNAKHGNTKIYANPYIQLDLDGNGEEDVVVGDTENVGKTAGNAWSLYDVLKKIDDNWASYADQQAAVKAFYGTWKDLGMSQYGFTNIS